MTGLGERIGDRKVVASSGQCGPAAGAWLFAAAFCGVLLVLGAALVLFVLLAAGVIT